MLDRHSLRASSTSLAAWAHVEASSLGHGGSPRVLASRRQYPVLRLNAANQRQMSWMREGLIPSYACDEQGADERDEAHAEALTCDACFRSAFRRRRCIVPATTMYEERHLGEGIDQRCSFALKSGAIFGIAAVWENWVNDQGHTIESFAIVTSLVTSTLRTVYDRLPVVLLGDKEQLRWLTREGANGAPSDLLKPLSVGDLCDWRMIPNEVDVHLGNSEHHSSPPAVTHRS